MSPRHISEETPRVDEIDAHFAEDMARFRLELDSEFGHRHLDQVSAEHPRFIDAAQIWMHTGEREIMAADPSLSLSDARLQALGVLRDELKADEEDPALLDIVETFVKVTQAEKKLGFVDTHDIAA